MTPYICPNSNFNPKAFKADLLKIEYETLFGENKNFKYQNIQLGGNCIVGYEYIEKTNEYKEGYCQALYTTTFRVSKELIKATTNDTEIILKEEVKYSSNEGNTLPEKLKNGTYVHKFKLDV